MRSFLLLLLRTASSFQPHVSLSPHLLDCTPTCRADFVLTTPGNTPPKPRSAGPIHTSISQEAEEVLGSQPFIDQASACSVLRIPSAVTCRGDSTHSHPRVSVIQMITGGGILFGAGYIIMPPMKEKCLWSRECLPATGLVQSMSKQNESNTSHYPFTNMTLASSSIDLTKIHPVPQAYAKWVASLANSLSPHHTASSLILNLDCLLMGPW
jgi:hypothetical protein